MAKVVHGLPITWEPTVATSKHSHPVGRAAWLPCSRFIAVDLSTKIEILDAVTLERLHIFVDPSTDKIQRLSFSPDSRSLTVLYRSKPTTIWDLQTGGRISASPSTPNTSSSRYLSSVYSMDGKILAVASRDWKDTITVTTYNLPSGTHIYSHCVSEGWIVAPIWTRGEFLRFATAEQGSIAIWEVGFTSKHALAEIESLPAPGGVGSGECLFLPTFSWLAFILRGAVLVWDARGSKFLLNFMSDDLPGGLSFSSGGRFFACGIGDREIYLWKKSPAGYVLHQKLVSNIAELSFRGAMPLLSPNGESIITHRNSQTQLWHTTDPISSPSSAQTQPDEKTHFVLAFSPDKGFIATGRLGGNIATIVDLKSGNPRLIVDTGMRICGLGVTGSTVVVVGEGKIITWDLPAGDCVLDARVNIHDSVRTIVFNHPPPPPEWLHSASISPNFNCLVITRGRGEGLEIYDMSTGKHLVGTTTEYVFEPWFTRDGREVWDSSGTPGGQKIIRGEGSDVIGLEPIKRFSPPSGGYLWESSHGHDVTDDGWILDPRKKRVMWLPHHLRVSTKYRIWSGRFFALFNPRLPEPIVIESDE